jgi:hypothetical protein
VNAIEELLGRKSSGSDLDILEYGRWDPSRRPRYKLYPQKMALTSPTSGGRSVDILRSRTKVMGFRKHCANVAWEEWPINIVSAALKNTLY